jgi:hypothetical protein
VTDPTTTPPHGSDMTVEEALGSLNYWDLAAIRREWKVSVSQIEERGDEITYALVWAIGKRANPQLTLGNVKDMTLTQVNAYFAADETDRDDEAGKEPTRTANPTVTSPAGASTQDSPPPPTAT